MIEKMMKQAFMSLYLVFIKMKQAAAGRGDEQQLIIPDELIYNVMLKLPLKTLVRFLTLSKSWKETITSRKFDMHRRKEMISTSPDELSSIANIFALQPPQHIISELGRMKKEFRLIYVHRIWGRQCEHRSVLELLIPNRALKLEVSSTCDGGVVVYLKKKFIIWNPYTGQLKEVSMPTPPPAGVALSGYEAAIDYYKLFVAFGYDATIDDYKLIVVYMKCRQVVQIMIRALRSSSSSDDDAHQWRAVYSSALDEPPFKMHVPLTMHQLEIVPFDGCFWWIAGNRESNNNASPKQQLLIIKLSMAEEKLSIVPPPPNTDMNDASIGAFYLLKHLHDQSIYLLKFDFDFSMKEEYLNIWRYINTNAIAYWELVLVRTMTKRLRPMGFTSNGTLLMEPSARSPPYDVTYAFCPTENSFFEFKIDIRMSPARWFSASKLFSQMETLISP